MEPVRSALISAARAILDQGGWCVLELCTDVPRQQWDAQVLVFDLDAEAVADAVAEEIGLQPTQDARITGCDRRTLQPDPAMGAYLCYLAEPPASAPASSGNVPRRPGAPARERSTMLVRDGMNPIVVTVGPDHTLREAARRMTARSVGAAVVIDEDAQGPGIITERDILHSNGVGQSIDEERVREHLTSKVVYAAADWPLERAASEMVRGGFRHVIVLEGSDVTGILSMRDIVRCWTGDGAACELPDEASRG